MTTTGFLRWAAAPVLGALLVTGCPDDSVDADGGASSTTGADSTAGDAPPVTSADSTGTPVTTTGLDGTTTTGMMDTGTDTGTTGGPIDPPGEHIVCDNVIAPAPAGEVCAVTPGDATMLLQGTVLAGFDVYENGTVLVDGPGPNAEILCVGCDCGAEPAAATATVVACADGVISPGLINPHDHITFGLSQPIAHGTERYDHRNEWRIGANGHTELNNYPGGASSREATLLSELRMLFGGATSISGAVGTTNTSGLLRNLDRDDVTEGLVNVDVNYSTFPLGDIDGTMLSSGCGYPFIDGTFELDDDIYMPHIAEGVGAEAHNEMECLSGAAGGEDLIASNTTVVHGIGMLADDIGLMGQRGAMVVWSPRSNIDLYGITTEVTTYRNLGVHIALGTDWSASGSMHLLRELKCADSFNQAHLDGAFTDQELWLMSTYWAALSQGAADQIGLLKPGHIADITIFDGSASADYRAIIDAEIQDVALVMRGGQPLVGNAPIVEALVDAGELAQCEAVDVCGTPKRACVELDTGLTMGAITSALNPDSYPPFLCGVPADEPSCDPYRPGRFPDRGGMNDADADGVLDDVDNCPAIFNPIRPMDGGVQADFDGDGIGDPCDACPLDDGEACVVPDAFDADADGVYDPDDNCLTIANVGQADGDGDGVGDACDACPMDPNPGGGSCPATIYEVKDGTIPLGQVVFIANMTVTGVAPDGYFLQVHPSDAEYLGPDFSGLYVYTGGSGAMPAVGDRVDVSGTVTDFFGQIQLSEMGDATVLSSGNPSPDPIVTTALDIIELGPLQEEYEGIIVTVMGPTVTDVNPPAGPGDDGSGEFEVTDGLRVDDLFYLVEPFPTLGQTYSQITGIARWANQYTKLEPRDATDYPPSLLAFGDPDSYLLVGSVATEPTPGLAATLNAPALAPTTVNLIYANPAVVTGPASVMIPMGATSAPVLLDGVSLGTADVTAELDGVMLATSVTVYDDAAVRVPTLSPAATTVQLLATTDLTVTLNLPAPVGDQVVDLSVAPGLCAAVPPTVLVPAGALSADFTVTAGACVGDEVVTAAIGPATSDATVSVVDAPAFADLVIAEVYYDHVGTDDLFEWVKIYNGTGATVDLSGYSLGWGGTDYTYGTMDLTGMVATGECFVVGGPSGDIINGFPGGPMYGQSLDFNPDIQNSGTTADGVALFDVAAASIGVGTVPIDAVIYGTTNDNSLLDETGGVGVVDGPDVAGGSSLRLHNDLTWAEEPAPAPLACVPFP